MSDDEVEVDETKDILHKLIIYREVLSDDDLTTLRDMLERARKQMNENIERVIRNGTTRELKAIQLKFKIPRKKQP